MSGSVVPRQWISVLGIALAFIAVAATGAVGQSGGNGVGADRSNDMADPRPGDFIVRNNIALGEYVGFTFDAAANTVSTFSVDGTAFFETITFPGPFEVIEQGGVVRLSGEGFNVTIHDNPVALMRFESTDATFLLKPPSPGVSTSYVQGETYNVGRVDLTADDREAFLTNVQPPRSWGITAQNGSLFKLMGSSVGDLANLPPFQDRVDAAILDGRVAAEYQMFRNGSDALIYQDVDVDFVRMENGSYRFVVDGHLDGGRSFVVNFAPGVFPTDNLNILYYNESFQALMPADIQQSSSLDDVLTSEPGESAEYWWVVDPAGTHVIVSIPSFSVHAFDVLGIPPELVPIIVYGIVGGVLFAFLAGVGMFLTPRRTR